MADSTDMSLALADSRELVLEEFSEGGAAVTWTAPDGSFSKKVLKAGEGLLCPHDGSKCRIVVWLLTDVSLTKEDVGCPIGERCELTRGESESEVAELIDLCLSTMHPGEVCELTAVVEDPNGGELGCRVGLRLKLMDFGDDVPPYLLDTKAKHQRSLHHKNRGKELFEKGNISYAFKRFFRSLRYLSTIAPEEAEASGLAVSCRELRCQLHSNMAACQLRRGSYKSVVANCSEVLHLDPGNVKALFRRAQAWRHLRELVKCKADLERALSREPRNSAILQSFREVTAALAAPNSGQ